MSSSEMSNYSMEEEEIDVDNQQTNQENSHQNQTEQTNQNNQTQPINYLQYFSRLFYIKKIVKEDDILELLRKHFPSVTIAPLIRELNGELQAYRMEIKRTINQSNGDFVYGLNTKDIDDINKIGCIFDQNDLKKTNDLFTLLCENDFTLRVDSLDEDFLDVYRRMKELHYYVEKDGIITFGPLYLINQEVDELHLPICEICNLNGSIGIYCPKDDCHKFYHVTCLKRMGRDSHTCTNCKTHLDYSN